MQGLHESVFSPLQAPLALGSSADAEALALAGYRSGPYSRADSPQLSITPSETTLDGRRVHDDFLGLGAVGESVGALIRRTAPSTPPSPLSVSSGSQESRECVAPRAPGKRRSVYEKVTAAYDYTPGYHALMKYLPERWVPPGARAVPSFPIAPCG